MPGSIIVRLADFSSLRQGDHEAAAFLRPEPSKGEINSLEI
jgi:hypothetical protein